MSGIPVVWNADNRWRQYGVVIPSGNGNADAAQNSHAKARSSFRLKGALL